MFSQSRKNGDTSTAIFSISEREDDIADLFTRLRWKKPSIKHVFQTAVYIRVQAHVNRKIFVVEIFSDNTGSVKIKCTKLNIMHIINVNVVRGRLSEN